MVNRYENYGHPTAMERRKRIDIKVVKDKKINELIKILEDIKQEYSNIKVVMQCPNEYSEDIESIWIFRDFESNEVWAELHSS